MAYSFHKEQFKLSKECCPVPLLTSVDWGSHLARNFLSTSFSSDRHLIGCLGPSEVSFWESFPGVERQLA